MSQIIALDTETTGLDLFHRAAPFMVCTIDDEGAYHTWQWKVNPKTREVIVDLDQWESLSDYIEGKVVVMHHADFDLRALARINIRLAFDNFIVPKNSQTYGQSKVVPVEAIHDTQLLSHAVNSQGTGDSEMGRHALKPLALHYLDISEGDESALRKATVSARRMAKSMGWTTGTSLGGDSEIEADYWMPRMIYKELSIRKQYGSVKDDVELELPPAEWENLCETYCKGDVYRTIGLYFTLMEILHQEGLEDQYRKEMELLPVTHLMEHFGLYADKDRCRKMAEDFTVDGHYYKMDAEAILIKHSGIKQINCNAGQQLATALEKSGIKLSTKTKPSNKFPQGQWATGADALRPIAQWCESPMLNGEKRERRLTDIGAALRLIIGYDPDKEGDEKYEKIPGYKTFQKGCEYINSYITYMDAWSVIHPSYHQVGTAWTRYSSREPNGQNISKKAVLPLRRLFGPPEGYVWFAIDYSQLELRIYAYASEDANLIAAFKAGYDFHSFSAMQMFGVANPESVTSEQRRYAKNVNFGVIFGAGPAKIDKTSGKPGTYQTYMEKFPNAKKFMSKISAQVTKHGYVTTLDGYRLYVPPEKPYVGTNAVIQGTAGRIIKNAMVRIHREGLVDWEAKSTKLPYGGSAIVANNHDELIIQIPKSYPYEDMGRVIMNVMEEEGPKCGVVTPVDAKMIFTNWGEGQKFV